MSTAALFPHLSGPSQGLLSFPVSLCDKYQPRFFSDFVGLDKPRAMLAKLAIEPRTTGGWIFTGPSGIGKTSMALALAREQQAELHHIPSQNCTLAELSRVRYSCNFVPSLGHRRHLVLVDEADRMTEGSQIALLSELDGTDATPLTTFVFTCNSTDRFEPRFLSRNRILEFSKQGISKVISDRLEYIWDRETGIVDGTKPNFARLVKDANNNIRAALMALEMEIMTI